MSAAAGTGGAAPIKILLVGPSKSRKSPLACMLAGQCDAITAINPGPTVGVRILELDRSGVAVELWDVAGDQSYEATWPAVMKDADGVLLVYNPEAPAAAVRLAHAGRWSQHPRGRSCLPTLLVGPSRRWCRTLVPAEGGGAVDRVVRRQAGHQEREGPGDCAGRRRARCVVTCAGRASCPNGAL